MYGSAWKSCFMLRQGRLLSSPASDLEPASWAWKCPLTFCLPPARLLTSETYPRPQPGLQKIVWEGLSVLGMTNGPRPSQAEPQRGPWPRGGSHRGPWARGTP